jgi:hypothetical protein
MTAYEAQSLLQGEPRETYLVRFSPAVRRTFTISSVHGGNIMHRRVLYDVANVWIARIRISL